MQDHWRSLLAQYRRIRLLLETHQQHVLESHRGSTKIARRAEQVTQQRFIIRPVSPKIEFHGLSKLHRDHASDAAQEAKGRLSVELLSSINGFSDPQPVIRKEPLRLLAGRSVPAVVMPRNGRRGLALRSGFSAWVPAGRLMTHVKIP
jgi:hypothetical protein